jgi:hypothetical protein
VLERSREPWSLPRRSPGGAVVLLESDELEPASLAVLLDRSSLDGEPVSGFCLREADVPHDLHRSSFRRHRKSPPRDGLNL